MKRLYDVPVLTVLLMNCHDLIQTSAGSDFIGDGGDGNGTAGDIFF